MKQIKIGTLADGSPLRMDVTKPFRAMVFASSGGGKTVTLFEILQQTRRLLPQCVIDPEADFTQLRRKYDYVLASTQGGDVLAHPSLAATLAKKWIDKNFNLILDLYEMKEAQRQEYVRIFLETVHDAPRTLWRPRLLLEDEIQDFAPEKGGKASSCLNINIDIAKKGRKRKIYFVAASQRPAEVSKAVTSQLGNKLIGVAYEDVDRERAAKELGFKTQEQILGLRRLSPGQFYAFGPALGHEVKLATITLPNDMPDEGGKVWTRPPRPSKRLKSTLMGLKELPKEAQEEAKTIETLKVVNRVLQKEKAELERALAVATKMQEMGHKALPAISKLDEAKLKKDRDQAAQDLKKAVKKLDEERIAQIRQAVDTIRTGIEKVLYGARQKYEPQKLQVKIERPPIPAPKITIPPEFLPNAPRQFGPGKKYKDLPTEGEKKMGGPEKSILKALLLRHQTPLTRVQVAVLSGYSPTSSSFSNALTYLGTHGYIERGAKIKLVDYTQVAGEFEISEADEKKNFLDLFLQNLGHCERQIVGVLLGAQGHTMTKEEIAPLALKPNGEPYSITSSSFTNALSKLNTLEIAVRKGGNVELNPDILAL